MKYLELLLKKKILLLFFFLQCLPFAPFHHLMAQAPKPPNIDLTATQKKEFDSLSQALSAAEKAGKKAKALANLVAFFSNFDAVSMKFYVEEIAQLANQTNDAQAQAFYSFAQAFDYALQDDFEQALESAKAHLKQAKQLNLDSITMLKAFYQVAYLFDDLGQIDSVVYYLNTAENLVPQNEKKYLGEIYSLYGRAYYLLSEPEKSIDYKRKAIAIKKEINAPSIAVDQANLGTYYLGQNEYEKAFEVWLEALEYFEKEGNTETIFKLYENICILLSEIGDAKGAREYIEKAFLVAQKDDYTIGMASANLMLSKIENQLFNYEESVRFALKALRLAATTSHQFTIGSCQYYAGVGYYNLQQLDSAEFYFNQCISIYEEQSISKLAIYSYASHSALGEIYKSKGDHISAMKNFQTYIDWLEQNGMYKSIEYGTYESLAESYEATDDYKNALINFKKAYSLKDSLLNIENIQEVAELKKETEFKAEKERTQAELERKDLIQKGLLLGFGALALLAFLIFRNYQISKKANQLINAQKSELERLNQTKDRLFSIIGHDLRKPAISFRDISKKISFLIDNQDFKTLTKFGKVIEKNAFTLTQLTDNLLNWALTQKQAISYRPEIFPLAEVTEDIFDLFQTIASGKNIDLKSHIPEDLEVYADLNSFNVILRNLIDNAVKYTPAGGTVEVGAKPKNDGVEIFVKDSGIGISIEKLNKLFVLKDNKSVRGTAGEKGTGLGLHLVKELVQLNKGAIEVNSQLQKGTEFSLWFPNLSHS